MDASREPSSLAAAGGGVHMPPSDRWGGRTSPRSGCNGVFCPPVGGGVLRPPPPPTRGGVLRPPPPPPRGGGVLCRTTAARDESYDRLSEGSCPPAEGRPETTRPRGLLLGARPCGGGDLRARSPYAASGGGACASSPAANGGSLTSQLGPLAPRGVGKASSRRGGGCRLRSCRIFLSISSSMADLSPPEASSSGRPRSLRMAAKRPSTRSPTSCCPPARNPPGARRAGSMPIFGRMPIVAAAASRR
mmetsp:Transcript_25852/g.82241  ORF Transcript_25852/g.82241 Transcript_25852/m.82241 type:complete len:247 (+) Transcript_25852:635-1375(+)